jgi:hypothetical protein
LIDSVKVKNPDSTKVVPPDTLKPAGAIKGIISLSEGGDPRQVFVLAFGIDRFARVNADGSFKFSNLARGSYDLRLISGLSNYGVLDTSGVLVIAGDTTDLGTISLPFTGIPTPKNLKVSFDTLKQFVILIWDKADTALVDGYNIYRAIKGQNFSLLTQTPLSETTTTYYDSGVAVGSTYEYRVVSRRISGEESPKVDIQGDTVVVVSSSFVTTTFTWNLKNTINNTASINDTVRVCVAYSNPTRKITGIIWYFDSLNSPSVKQKADSSLAGKDTLVYWWKQAGDKKVFVEVTDEAGTVWTGSVVVMVVQDAPVPNAGKDTTVSLNDTVHLHGSATQQFGTIVEWAWDIGNTGIFKVISKADTTIVAPSSENLNYLCMLRVKDDDGNMAKDTVKITVLRDAPVANAGKDTAARSSAPYTLHGTATQQFGTIVKWEWNINNAGFAATSSGDTTITTPALSAESLVCVLRVTDDDSNTGMDTVVLRLGAVWEAVGMKAFSNGNAGMASLATYNGTPYLAFQDATNNGKAIVMRYDGSAWAAVGNQSLSDGQADDISLTIYNGTPYLAFRDDANGRKATVMNYSGSTWAAVGNKGFTEGGADNTSLAVYNGIPYVAFTDDANGKATVMRYDGSTWVPVGNKAFSDSSADFTSLAIDNGTPYVAFKDEANGNGVTVMKYDGSAWVAVGNKAFSNGAATFTSLVIYNGTPYVLFGDGANGGKATLMKYSGSTWMVVGNRGFSDGWADYTSLAIYNGKPYVSFQDAANGYKATVMRYDGGVWVAVGNKGFSDGRVYSTSLAINNGIPYIAFPDEANGGKTTVMRLW